MKKRSVIAALLCSLCLTAGGAVPAMADSARVVTLGADLTQDQKDTMMRYFKTDASQVQILTSPIRMKESIWEIISRWSRSEQEP